MRSRLLRFAATAAVVAVPLTACGSGSPTTTSSSGTTAGGVTVHAKDTLTFDKSSYEATAGNVTLNYVNDGNIPHTLDIEGQSFEIDVNSHGQQKSASINLAPGTYTLYCNIPGHRSAGMHATLTVK
jgi:uncharacterized cupredoxin-like copper-binding protein